MALDGVVLSSIVYELNEKLIGCRIEKISQPEKDEVVFSIRGFGKNFKLLITSNANSPRIHITEILKQNPLKAPLFCMVLRKHISNGKIINISQPNFERIVEIQIETLNEMSDISTKKIIIEIMGKHSNIILTDDKNIILDSIKHITFETSSVREVIPGKLYVRPPNQNKHNPMNLEKNYFYKLLSDSNTLIAYEFIFKSFTGISYTIAQNICKEADIRPETACNELDAVNILKLYNSLYKMITDIKSQNYLYQIIYDYNNLPIDFTCIQMKLYEANKKTIYSSASAMLEIFYKEKDLIYRMKQRSSDVKKLVTINIDRCKKKHILYDKTLKKIKNRDILKICGELIISNIHILNKGMEQFTTQNFYDESLKNITITLNPNLTPSENAQGYFKRYNKEKRTFFALQEQIKQNSDKLAYLETILNSIDNCKDESDIEDIRTELADSGFIKRRVYKKGEKPKTSHPLHFTSTNGFDIYVGKNNIQNDKLTLKFAQNNDYWFHVKDIPGSHVILQTKGQQPKNKDLLDAANIAAYYSKARNSGNTAVDYAYKKFVKKPNGAKPGMVIYTNNKTIYITPDKYKIENLETK